MPAGEPIPRLESLRRVAAGSALALAVAACADDPATPPVDDAAVYAVAVRGGDDQVGLPGQPVARPLRVLVVDTRTDLPVPDAAIAWTVLQGAGANISPAVASTDSAGIATASLTLGQAPGAYLVRAALEARGLGPAEFSARALDGEPEVVSVTPVNVTAGDTVHIAGRRFGDRADLLAVLIGGFAASIVDASDSGITAVVPRCLPDRATNVLVRLGGIPSNTSSISVAAADPDPVALEVGSVRTFEDPAEFACLTLDPSRSGSRFLLVVGNATAVTGTELDVQLNGALDGPLASTLPAPGEMRRTRAAVNTSCPAEFVCDHPGLAWERVLRKRVNQELRHAGPLGPRMQAGGAGDEPVLGEERQFWVIGADQEYTRVRATVTHVGAHAVIYQDVRSAHAGLGPDDFALLGGLFDDPIYETTVEAFGAPSDLDGNGRVVVLLTPVVNGLTPRGSLGFIGGFFFPCDLATCENTNRAEIFYGLVPDPDGVHGDARTREDVLEALPPLLAHEFQHMIHFNQRNLMRGAFTQESLWLSEGLAHAAEERVAEVFDERGDASLASEFRIANRSRAYLFLGTPEESPNPVQDVSLLAGAGLGTLEQRGAAWLFVEYLFGRHGPDILRQLTATTLSGTINVRDRTESPWSETLTEWSLALWADDAPELAGAAVEPRYTFPHLDLRSRIYSESRGGFALQPATQTFGDFENTENVVAASAYYLIIDAAGAATPFGLGIAPALAGFGAHAVPRVSILRIR